MGGRTACTDRGGGGRKPGRSGQHVPHGPSASRRPYKTTETTDEEIAHPRCSRCVEERELTYRAMPLRDQERGAVHDCAKGGYGANHAVEVRQLAPVAGGAAAITAWLAVLGLVTTPVMLHTLGASAYAVFALITIMIGYLSNLQLGFGEATLRFLARARAMGDDDAAAKIVGTSLFVFSCAGAVGAVVAFFAASVVVTSFANFPKEVENDAVGAIRLAALALVLTFLYSFAQVSLQALGRFRPLLWSRAIFGTVLSGSAVAAALVFEDVRAVLAAQVIVSLLACIVLFTMLARALSARLRPSFHFATFCEMSGFGALALATGLAYQAMMQGPPTVLVGLAPASEVAAFAVAAVVFQQILLLSRAAGTGFKPFASAESAAHDRARLARVFHSYLRLTIAVIGPATGFLLVFAKPLLTVWLGGDFAEQAADPLKFLALAGFLLALSTPSAEVANGIGRVKWNLAYALAAGAIGSTAALLLAGRSGASGAALGLLIGVSVVTLPFILLTTDRLLGEPPMLLVRSVLLPGLGALAAVGMYFLGSLLAPGVAGVALGGAFTVPYAITIYNFVLDEDERRTLKKGADGFTSTARSAAKSVARRPRRKATAPSGPGGRG